jgi:hypothetical protein
MADAVEAASGLDEGTHFLFCRRSLSAIDDGMCRDGNGSAAPTVDDTKVLITSSNGVPSMNSTESM